MFFDDSPVFRLEPDAAAKGVKPLAWFDNAAPLRSGWAWGQNYLQGGTAMVQADVGTGKLYMFGPEILFRGQPARDVQAAVQRDLLWARREDESASAVEGCERVRKGGKGERATSPFTLRL